MKGKKHYVGIDDSIVQGALSSGLYKKDTVYSNFYLYWRLHNPVIPVRRDVLDSDLQTYLTTLCILDDMVTNMNHKVCIGAYIFKQICPNLVKDVFIDNPNPTMISVRRV
jgi:hypothetical protein